MSVSEDDDSVILRFDNGGTLSVSLLDEAWHGPEALVMHREGRPIVVWN